MEFKSISELKSLLFKKKISVKEIADSYIKSIKAKKELNIFIYFNENKIYDQVKEIEKLPETLDKLESNERLNILLKLMPYVFPKVQKIHSNEGEPLEW